VVLHVFFECIIIASASDPDQEHIYLKDLETLPSACYILSDESGIPFHSTGNGYKYFPPCFKNFRCLAPNLFCIERKSFVFSSNI